MPQKTWHQTCPYPKCQHEWEARKENPLECPACKRRLDHVPEKSRTVTASGD